MFVVDGPVCFCCLFYVADLQIVVWVFGEMIGDVVDVETTFD